MPTSTATEHADALALLHEWLGEHVFDDSQFCRVLEVCEWDADFARVALTMTPRPSWCSEIVHSDVKA